MLRTHGLVSLFLSCNCNSILDKNLDNVLLQRSSSCCKCWSLNIGFRIRARIRLYINLTVNEISHVHSDARLRRFKERNIAGHAQCESEYAKELTFSAFPNLPARRCWASSSTPTESLRKKCQVLRYRSSNVGPLSRSRWCWEMVHRDFISRTRACEIKRLSLLPWPASIFSVPPQFLMQNADRWLTMMWCSHCSQFSPGVEAGREKGWKLSSDSYGTSIKGLDHANSFTIHSNEQIWKLQDAGGKGGPTGSIWFGVLLHGWHWGCSG